jgi:hypothetical protein
LPAEHDAHAVRPDAAAKVPGAHAWQVRLSTAFENWPAGHGTHVSAGV